MTSSNPDKFLSPNDGHEYIVRLGDVGPIDDTIDRVQMISGDGAVTHTAKEVMIDREKLNSRLTQITLRQTINSADFRWAFGDQELARPDA